MTMHMYDDLTPWYRLLDPHEDHLDEAVVFTAAFERAVTPRPETLLELGSGAGHNAFHLKGRFACTLADLSPRMLALSRELNPECEHVQGDMRTLRLDRTFDAVLIHDAIVYMTTEDDLRAAMATAFEHLRPGGAAIFATDFVTETFVEDTDVHESTDAEGRALRVLEWDWDPDPADTSVVTEYVFAVREGGEVRIVHDRHVSGLFPRATWMRLLREVGFEAETVRRPVGDGEFDDVFLGVRPR